MSEQGTTIMGVGQGADEATAATEPVCRPDSLPTKKALDFWLCWAIGLYVFNLVGWAGYFIWRIWS